MVKVHYGEGVATHTGPESCGCGREAAREALTGVRAGQVWSGESNVVRGADAVVAAEGNRIGSVSARTWATPRRLRACLTILCPSVFKLPCAHCQLLLIDQEGSSMPSSLCNW